MTWANLLRLDSITGVIAIVGGLPLLFIAIVIIPISMACYDWKQHTCNLSTLHVGWILLMITVLLTSGTNPHYLAPLFSIFLILWCRWWERVMTKYYMLSLSILATLALILIACEAPLYAVDA